MYGIQEAVHLLNGIWNQYSLKIVAIFQTAANSSGDSINIDVYKRQIYKSESEIPGNLIDRSTDTENGADAKVLYGPEAWAKLSAACLLYTSTY